VKHKTLWLAVLVIASIVLVVEVAGPIIRAYTPHGAHAWIGNFGGGLLAAVLVTAAVTHFFIDRDRRIFTATRLTFALVGILLLLVFRADVSCHVEFGGRTNPIVCD